MNKSAIIDCTYILMGRIVGRSTQADYSSMALHKTVTFACVHFAVAFGVAYAITGSLVVGGLLAVVEPLVNTGAYYLHERMWGLLQGEPVCLPK